MEFFQHRYYRLGKILMSLLGQWPTQSTCTRCGILVSFLLFGTYGMLSQLLPIGKYWGDVPMILDALIPNTCIAVYATKYVGLTLNQQKGVQTVKLLNRIRTNWQVWAHDREVKILHQYAHRGEKITVVYTAMLYACMIMCTVQPIIRKLIHDTLNNDTAPGTFLFPMSYHYVDERKYFYHLSVYWVICSCMLFTGLTTSEVMLILYVQHVCGIFTALGHKLERIGSKGESGKTEESSYEFSKTQMMHLCSCIARHNDAIEFADLIRTTYAWNFFITIGLGMGVCNAAGIQLLMKPNDLGEASVFIILLTAVTSYFYIECYVAQILMDHSISICIHVNNSQWYRLPPKAQKFLQLITIRCYIPCQLTAGNILTMSIESFGTVIKTFMSYFACFRSMRAA